MKPAVVMTMIKGWRRAPMPVIMVSYRRGLSCSWYSSTMAQCGDAPSPGFPINGANLEADPMIFMFFASTSTP